MRGFVLRTLMAAFGIWLAVVLVSGISTAGDGELGTILLAALVLSLLNAFVRPILMLVTLPITILTLGLFLLVINAAMLGLAGSFVPGFEVDGFGPALFGSIIVSLTSWIGSWWVGPGGRVEAIYYERRRRS